MNLKKTIVLAAILLAAFLYLRTVSLPASKREAEKGVVFPGINVADLESIRVQRRPFEDKPPQEYTLRVRAVMTPTPTPVADGEQAEGGATGPGGPTVVWELPTMTGAELDTAVVDAVAGAARGLDVGAPIKESALDKDGTVFGFDKPALTLLVRPKGKEEVEIAFGSKNEYLSKRYVKVSGRSGIFLVDDGVFFLVDKGIDDVRSKNPVQFRDADVREVSISSAAGVLQVRQVSSGEWKVVSPVELPASGLAVSALLRELRELRSTEFLENSPERRKSLNFRNPIALVTVFFPAELKRSPLEVSLYEGLSHAGGEGGAEEGAEVERSGYFISSAVPTLFKSSLAGSDFASKFAKGVDDLRDKRLFSVKSSDLKRVLATGGGVGSNDVSIDVTATDWSVNGKRSDPMFVEQYLNDLVALEASEYPSEVPADALSEVFVRLELTRKEPADAAPIILTVGKEATGKKGPGRWARVGDTGPTVLIADVEAKRVVPHEEALVEVTPTPTPAPTVASAVTPAAIAEPAATPTAAAAE
jgi:hypothetical protein